jgi:hypothetical protein
MRPHRTSASAFVDDGLILSPRRQQQCVAVNMGNDALDARLDDEPGYCCVRLTIREPPA